MSSADEVKRIRTKLCLEQDELAKLLGISKSAISNYERGIRVPRIKIVRKLRDLAKENNIEFNMDSFIDLE